MMNGMNTTKNRRPMQEPVTPIKVSVVDQDHKGNRRHEVKPTSVRHAKIESSVRFDCRAENNGRDNSKNDACSERITHFPKVISDLREPRLDFAMQQNAPANNIKQDESDAGKNEVADCRGRERERKNFEKAVHARRDCSTNENQPAGIWSSLEAVSCQ